MIDGPVKTALYSRLSGDSTLTALTGGTAQVYDTLAPQNAGTATVVYQKQSGVPQHTFGTATAWEDQLYMVKAITQGSSVVAGQTILSRVDALLNNQPLSVSGGTQFYLQRVNDLPDYREVVNSITYNHTGASYRLMTS